MKSASGSGSDWLGEQRTLSGRHQRVMRWLLGAVAGLALLSAMALWLALRQAYELSRTGQVGDLWYVSSVNGELLRLSLEARRVMVGEPRRDELLLRLEVLQSVLDQSAANPKVLTGVRQHLPEVTRVLDELTLAAGRWGHDLAAPDGLQRVIDEASQFHDRTASAVADVHLRSFRDAEHERQQLLHGLVQLCAALTCLLLGAGTALWRAHKAHRIALAHSHALNDTNRLLEARIRERTRRIDESRNLLAFILDASPSDVALIETGTGRVHFINQRLRARLRLHEPLPPLRLQALLHDPDAARLLQEMLDESGQADGVEALIASHPPSWSALSARLIDVEGRLCHLIWGFDISTHKRLEAELRTLATTDSLSGLNNRRAFLETGSALLEHCRRYHRPCGALMIDIDHFKRINDRHGHPIGDEAIRATARLVLEVLRDADVVGRLGGEEFAALVPHADAAGVRDTAERLRQAVQALAIPLPDAQPLQFTISIGCATFEGGALSLDELLQRADQALYRAKSGGRNRVETFVPDPPPPARQPALSESRP